MRLVCRRPPREGCDTSARIGFGKLSLCIVGNVAWLSDLLIVVGAGGQLGHAEQIEVGFKV